MPWYQLANRAFVPQGSYAEAGDVIFSPNSISDPNYVPVSGPIPAGHGQLSQPLRYAAFGQPGVVQPDNVTTVTDEFGMLSVIGGVSSGGGGGISEAPNNSSAYVRSGASWRTQIPSDVISALGYTPVDTATRGALNGIPTLSGGLVPISQLPVATTTSKGIVSIGTGLAITLAGQLSAALPAIPTSALIGGNGSAFTGVQIGSGMSLVGNVLSANSGITDAPGGTAIFGRRGGTWANLSGTDITTALGFTPLNVTARGTASGVASLDSASLIPVTQLPIATTTVVGAAKFGSGLSIDGAGLVTATGTTLTVPNASIIGGNGTALTTVTVGSGLAFSSGTLSATAASPPGTSGQLLYNNAGAFGALTLSGDATLVASTGVVTVAKTGGAFFAASATTDTTNAANITSGTVAIARLPRATSTTLGLMIAGSGLAVDGSGVVTLATAPPAIPNASLIGGNGTTLNAVTVGSGLAFASNTLSLNLPTASTTVLGGVKVDGTSVTIASGVISTAGGPAQIGALTAATTLASTDFVGANIGGNDRKITIADMIDSVLTPVASKTANYTAIGDDNGTWFMFNSASAMAITLNNLGIGVSFVVTQESTGAVTFTAGTGMTTQSLTGSNISGGQGSVIQCVQVSSTKWVLSGALQ